MSRNRFVVPTVVRHELSESDWCELKGRLTYLESQKLSAAAFGGMRPAVGDEQPEFTFNAASYALAQLEAWIVDWSFQGPDGRTVPVNRDSLSALDEETADELIKAIARHSGVIADEKKVRSIETLFAQTSP